MLKDDSKLKLLVLLGAPSVVVLITCLPVLLILSLPQIVLISIGLRELQLRNQLKLLFFYMLNFALATYLLVGLPFETGSKNQFVSVFGKNLSRSFWDTYLSWGSIWTHAFPGPKGSGFVPIPWTQISSLVWLGLILVFASVLFGILLIHNRRRKEVMGPRGLRVYRPEPNALGKALSYPSALLIKLLVQKPAWDGHHYAIAVKTKHYQFLKHMTVDGILYSLLSLPFLLRGYVNSELWTLASAVLMFPLLGMLTALLLGLFPKQGDKVNSLVFQSPFDGAPGSDRNPFHKPKPKGFVLGHDSRGEYRLTERNLNHHVQILAPSGGGKTNIIKNLIADRIANGHGVIFLDYKADFEVAEFIYRQALEAKRAQEIRIFSLSNREISVPYNPISHGSAAELQSRLMNAFTWSDEVYYRSKAESTLLKIFRGLTELRDLGNETLTLKTVFDVLTKKGYARELAVELRELGGKASAPLEEIAAMLDRPSEAKELQGLITNLEKVIYSGAGELLTEDAGPNSFTVEEAIEKGLITYFLMNSLSSKETATTVGKLLLQDLMGYVGRSYEKKLKDRKPITIIIDEFAEFAIPEFPSFLNRVRGAGINVVIAHQTRSDLKAVSDDYQSKIEANTNTKIIAGVTDPEDAQFYAEMIGTRTVLKATVQTQEEGLIFKADYGTGAKSVRETEEFIIHPNRIKRIEQGAALVISRTVDTGYGIIKIPRARDTASETDRPQIEEALHQTRETYLSTSSPGLKLNLPVSYKSEPSASMWD